MTKTTKAAPLVTDDSLRETDDRVRRASLGNYAALEMIRDHYEAHFASLTKERDEAMSAEDVKKRVTNDTAGMSFDELVEYINDVRAHIHSISPFAQAPVLFSLIQHND